MIPRSQNGSESAGRQGMATEALKIRRAMVVQAEVALLADRFWARVGELYAFPRDIERAAMIALPIVIVKLPRLTSQTLAEWLRARGAIVVVPICETNMAGCLVAHRGRAVIFVAGTDAVNEQ